MEEAATERLLQAALPPGWSMIGRCRFGTAVPGPHATGCHALAHPRIGLALIDIAPDATPNAESRLRRALSAAEFWPDFPGNLPVWHGRLDSPALRDLGDILEEQFSGLPPLTVPGGQAWIGAVRQALGQDQAWEVPGQARRPALPLPPPDTEEPDEEPRRPGWNRTPLLLALGFAGTFGLGLAAGLILLPAREPMDPPAAPVLSQRNLAAETAPAAPPQPAVAEPTVQPPSAVAPAPVPAMSAVPVLAEPEPEEARAAAAPLPLDDQPNVFAAPATPTPEPMQPMTAGGQAAPPPAEPSEEPELPPAPPPAPPAPALHNAAHAQNRAARSASGIDRACGLALFRYQQGEAISPADRVHVREGCATRR